MADVEAAFPLDAPAWHKGPLPEEEEQGPQPEEHDLSQAEQRGELDQRIARVLGNLDKVVKDPTRGGAMAGDYGTFMPVVPRGGAGALLPEQMFVSAKGAVDIPSLRPRPEAAPPCDTPPPVPPVPRPKSAAKKATGPASTVLVNLDPSLFSTDMEPSRTKKPLKSKPKVAANSSKLGDLPSSPLLTPNVRHLLSTPPGSPGFRAQTPPSNASSPARSPASILKFMTTSALPSGAYLSPLGEMAPCPRPASQRYSSLGALHERLANAGGAVDTSSDKEERDGTQRDPQSPSKLEVKQKKTEGKKDKSKKRVEGKKGPSDREDAKSPALVPKNSIEKAGRDREDLIDNLLSGEIEDFLGKETPGSQKQQKVGRRQLVQQISIDQERLQAILGAGDAPDLLDMAPQATLKEIERLKNGIERKEEMLRRKLEEQEDSESSSEEESGGERYRPKPGGVKENGKDKKSTELAPQVHGSAAVLSGAQEKMDEEEGNKKRHAEAQESEQALEQSAREAAAQKEERRRKRRELKEELRQVAGQVRATDVEPAKTKPKEKRSVEEREDQEAAKGGKEVLRGKSSREGNGTKQASGLAEGQKKIKKKKKLLQKGASGEVLVNGKADFVKRKEAGFSNEYPQRGNSIGETNSLKKKQERRHAGGNQVKSASHEHRPSSDPVREQVMKKDRVDTGTALKTKQLQAAAREALPEAQRECLRQARETGKLVAQAQAQGFFLLGPRTAPGNDEYVCCDRCDTWRMLPYWLHEEQFSEVDWTCDDVDWLAKEYVGCKVDAKVFEEQTKYVNYPPVGGWDVVRAELDKQGGVNPVPPAIASPGKKAKHSVFQQRVEKGGKLIRGQSANGRKDKPGGGEERGAKSPLGGRKRLLKEGERQKRRVQLDSNDSAESSGSDGEHRGEDRKQKVKKEKVRVKKRKVVSDKEESDGEAVREERKEQSARDKARKQQECVEEEDWVVDEEPSNEEGAPQQTGGPIEQHTVDQIGARGHSPEATGVGTPVRDRDEERRPAVSGERKEQKRKLDEIKGEGRGKDKSAKVEREGVPKLVERQEGARAGEEIRRQSGKEEPGAPPIKKKKKAKKLVEADGAVPEMPGLQTSTKAPRRREEEVGTEEEKDRESKRQKVAGVAAAQGKGDSGAEAARTVEKALPAEAVGPSPGEENQGKELSGPGGPRARTEGTEQKNDGVAGGSEGRPGAGTQLSPDLSERPRGVDQSEVKEGKLSTQERNVGARTKTSGETEEEGIKEDAPMEVERAESEAKGRTSKEEAIPAVEPSARKTHQAEGAADHPFLEEDTSAAAESKEGAKVAAPVLAQGTSWLPRQVQVGTLKVASTESTPGKAGEVQEPAAKPAEQATKSKVDENTSNAAAKDEPASVHTSPKNEEKVRGETTPGKRSDPPATALQRKPLLPKKHKEEKGARHKMAASSEDSSSSSEVSSSDLSSDGSELAQEEVVQPVKKMPPLKDGSSREVDGKEQRKGIEQGGTSRSTIVHVASPKRREHSPLRRRGLSGERDSPPPSRGERRDWDRREWERGSSYRSSSAGSDRHRTPGVRDRARDRERSRFYDDRDRGRRDYDRGYDRDRRYRREELSPWRDRRGGEHDRRSSRPERSGSKDRSRSRSESLGREAGGIKRAGAPNKGGSRQASPSKDPPPSKEGGAQKSTPSLASTLTGGPVKTAPESASVKLPQLSSPPEAKVSSPPDTGVTMTSTLPAPKAPSESSRMAGSMAPPPPPAMASGPAAVGGDEDARKQFQKLMKEAKDTKHAADNLKAQSQLGIAGTVYLDAALKFLLAASSLESADPKQASGIFQQTAEWLEGLCLGFYRPNQALAAEALAWKCNAIARTRSLQAIRDRVLKYRAALHDCLLTVPPAGVPGAIPRPPSAGPQVPGNQGVGTPPQPIHIMESPSSSSASEADAAQVAVSLGPHHREPFSSMLHVVQEHFQITACWTRAASVAAQAAKDLKPEALSALTAVGEHGGVGCLESMVQAARIALDKFSD